MLAGQSRLGGLTHTSAFTHRICLTSLLDSLHPSFPVHTTAQVVLWHAPWAVASREAEAALEALAARQQQLVFVKCDLTASQVRSGRREGVRGGEGLGGAGRGQEGYGEGRWLGGSGWMQGVRDERSGVQGCLQSRDGSLRHNAKYPCALQHAHTHTQANEALATHGLKLVAPPAGRRADARPTLRPHAGFSSGEGGGGAAPKWPALSLHGPPALSPEALFAGPTAVADLR